MGGVGGGWGTSPEELKSKTIKKGSATKMGEIRKQKLKKRRGR